MEQIQEIIDSLLKLEKQIEEAKKHADQLEGRLQEQIKRLKTDFNVDSLEKGIKLLEQLKTELEKKEEETKLKFKNLTEEFDW